MSNNFRELHEKNKTTTLGGSTGDKGGFLGAALLVFGQQRPWEYPGCRAFSLWFPLGLLPEGGSSRLGMLSGRSGCELSFTEMCENMLKIALCVCAHSQEDMGTVLPTCRAAWEGFQLLWTMQTEQAPGKRDLPAPVLTVCVEGYPQFLGARLRVPGFVYGQTCSQHCFVLHE